MISGLIQNQGIDVNSMVTLKSNDVEKREMKMIRLLLPLLLFLVACGDDQQSGPQRPMLGSVVQADGQVVIPGPVTDQIWVTGSLMAEESVELRSEVSGRVVDIPFREGASVKKGDLLFKLYDADLQATLSKLQVQEKLAADVENRNRQLFAKNQISQEEYDRTLTSYQSVKADVEFTRAQLSKTEIRAPFNGIAGLRQVSPGAVVNANTTLGTLASSGGLKMDFSVPGKYASAIIPGRTVSFTVSGLPDTGRAVILASETRIQEQTRTLLVRARIEEKPTSAFPGSLTRVRVVLSDLPSALMVPSFTLVPDLQGDMIFVMKNGLADKRLIRTGIRTETHVQVLGGLAPGDTILTSALLQLRPGVPVKVRVQPPVSRL